MRAPKNITAVDFNGLRRKYKVLEIKVMDEKGNNLLLKGNERARDKNKAVML